MGAIQLPSLSLSSEATTSLAKSSTNEVLEDDGVEASPDRAELNSESESKFDVFWESLGDPLKLLLVVSGRLQLQRCFNQCGHSTNHWLFREKHISRTIKSSESEAGISCKGTRGADTRGECPSAMNPTRVPCSSSQS